VPAASRNLDVIAVNDALQDLTKLNAQHARIVELRFFGGLKNEEVAEFLDLSQRTVKRASTKKDSPPSKPLCA
jgi:DNA-directed RNA polymerase specialized sigma24 family protein